MSFMQPIIHESVERDVGNASAQFSGGLEAGRLYRLISNTACWIRQGVGLLITCLPLADLLDNETVTLVVDGESTIFDLDVDGVDDGVAGHVRVDVSGATTAADVAAILAPLIASELPDLVVTDHTNGTIRVEYLGGGTLTGSDTVADTDWLMTADSLLATKVAGSMFVGAGEAVLVDAKHGLDLAILRDAADGKSTLTPVRFVR